MLQLFELNKHYSQEILDGLRIYDKYAFLFKIFADSHNAADVLKTELRRLTQSRCTLAPAAKTLSKEAMDAMLVGLHETFIDLEIPFEDRKMDELVCIYLFIYLYNKLNVYMA